MRSDGAAPPTSAREGAIERRALTIEGVVQGVGFRPHVYRLARKFALAGSVRNCSGSVVIEVEGAGDDIDRFLEHLLGAPPPLARIMQITDRRATRRGERGFRIAPSELTAGEVRISHDVATCADCLAELFDPADRRYRYPFLNCTNCGPRLTIVTAAPYDRGRTTMSRFPMCAECTAEYHNPLDRRFHAQPIACPVCGPQLALADRAGATVACRDVVETAAEALLEGRIVAIKGIGGFHLACDAANAFAVRELRKRKQRDARPLAVMAADLAQAVALCEIDGDEQALLEGARRPIVLLRKRAGAEIAEDVAPGNPYLGVMLPYSPLHHLLLRAVRGAALVMTSGNRTDEPIACDNDDALRRLRDVADLFVLHDREIRVRCDDSVTRIVAGAEAPVRRSRGYAPHPVRLPMICEVPILAVGGQWKGTFALGRRRDAVLSHHLGDHDHLAAYDAFRDDIAHYERVFGIHPRILAHDLHPEYATTRYAWSRAANEGLELVAVQHHHAHLASCMAEHGLVEPVIGVCFDGTGLGEDGAVWGGEFLVGDLCAYTRAAHLRYVGMPGGDGAVREPWRMALAHLMDAGCECTPAIETVDARDRRIAARLLEQRTHAPRTSSAGRLFDAVAAMVGLGCHAQHEAQCAMRLEWAAGGRLDGDAYPVELVEPEQSGAPLAIDTRPLIRAIAADIRHEVPAQGIASRFHAALVALIERVCSRLRAAHGVNAVVLGGGVFMNVLLLRETLLRLESAGFRVYRPSVIPCNDGGLSLGQLAVAGARAAARSSPDNILAPAAAAPSVAAPCASAGAA